jgi:hypothetical protein
MLQHDRSAFERVLDGTRKRAFGVALAPEEQFSTQGQIDKRFHDAVQSPEIDRAMARWHIAKNSGDKESLEDAAKSLVAATAAAYRMQGVPLFAHPPLPPQFVASEAHDIASVPAAHRSAILSNIVEKFEPSVRALASQQFLGKLQAPAPQENVSPAFETHASAMKGVSDRATDTLPLQQLGVPGEPDFSKLKKKINLGPRPPLAKRPIRDNPGEFFFYLAPPHPGYVAYAIDNTPIRTWTSDQEIFIRGRDDDNDGQPDGWRIHQFLGQ